MPLLTRRSLGASLIGYYLAAPVAHAIEALPSPGGKPILTVSGQIARSNVDGSACFDRDMLESLGLDSFRTTTPWYNGPVSFEGVKMTRLMEAVGARGTTVTAVALNDYTTELPVSDFEKYNVILAIKRDGNYMPVRDKGPLFIVYPFDDLTELKSQTYYSRSAWQVTKLVVK